MATFPSPPPADRLGAVREDDDVVAVTPATPLARIYRAGGRHPAAWNAFRTVGPVDAARFDPHPPPERPGELRDVAGCGVMYLGLRLQTCVAETFQATRVADRTSARPWLVVWQPTRPLRLLDLTGSWPTRAGASQAISSGSRPRAREWARAIRASYDDLDGLWYRSAMDGGEPAICLWEPGRDALPDSPWAHLPLDADGLVLPLQRVCAAVGYLLV